MRWIGVFDSRVLGRRTTTVECWNMVKAIQSSDSDISAPSSGLENWESEELVAGGFRAYDFRPWGAIGRENNSGGPVTPTTRCLRCR